MVVLNNHIMDEPLLPLLTTALSQAICSIPEIPDVSGRDKDGVSDCMQQIVRSLCELGPDNFEVVATKLNDGRFTVPLVLRGLMIAICRGDTSKHIRNVRGTIGHIRTMRDRKGRYPSNPIGSTARHTLYPFKFTHISFVEMPGPTDPSISFLYPGAAEDGYLVRLLSDRLLDVGTDLLAMHVRSNPERRELLLQKNKITL
jgi:hypothetical protein